MPEGTFGEREVWREKGRHNRAGSHVRVHGLKRRGGWWWRGPLGSCGRDSGGTAQALAALHLSIVQILLCV